MSLILLHVTFGWLLSHQQSSVVGTETKELQSLKHLLPGVAEKVR